MNRLDQLKSVMSVVAKTMKSGQVFANDETILARFNICEACPNLKYNQSDKPTCSICGCALRKKLVIEGATCPEGKW